MKSMTSHKMVACLSSKVMFKKSYVEYKNEVLCMVAITILKADVDNSADLCLLLKFVASSLFWLPKY